MPYKIVGKVLDEQGLPIGHTVQITEKPTVGNLGIGDVFADDDGSFTILALSGSSFIEISSYGYATQVFPATGVPAEIKLKVDPALILNGTTKAKPKSNAWIWIAGLALAGLALASSKDAKKPARTPRKRIPKRTPSKSTQRKPKMVVV